MLRVSREANIMLKRIIPVTAITLLMAGFALSPVLALLPIGQQVPDFQLNDLYNNPHRLSGYQGKVVVIDFFEAYCQPCAEDAKTNLVPLFNSYYANDPNVQFLSVEVTGASVAEIQSSYLATTGAIPWPILIKGQSLQTSYSIASTPTLYVVNSVGKVAATMEYPTDVQALKSTIDQCEGKVASTQLTLSASTTAPAVGQSVAFTATLRSGSTPLSAKPVTIYHYSNGVRYDDVTNKNTNANGQVTATVSFASAGERTYYATFGGDSSYPAATSSVLAIYVK
jgi:thiol-disulfide isomerase/thioredoxin